MTAGDGTEISGTALQVARANGRSLATDAASSGTNPRDLNGRTLAPTNLDNPGNLARVRLAPLFSGSGTTNRIIKWLDGPNGVGGDTVMSEVAGKVGYGTSNPAANLHLFTPGTTDNMVLLMENGTRQWSFGFNGGQDFFRIRDNTAGAARFVIKETGNIGIGTTSPVHKLHVLGGSGTAVYGETSGGTAAFGVYGVSTASGGYGVYGFSDFNGVNAYGVFGQARGNGVAVQGNLAFPEQDGYAGYFNGRTHVNGDLSKSSGSFKIDHPLDPANKYLYHSFVESPDMMNIYNGNVTTDQQGLAAITLPDYFEALNREFRYQLTVIGKFAQAIVSEEINGNQFRIETNQPYVKVSWQVTGLRQDAYAEAHRIPTEELKSKTERGSYLPPEVHGQPEEKGIEWVRQPEMMKRLKEQREKAEKEKKAN